MKKIILLIMMFAITLSVSAKTTDASKYAENQYYEQFGKKPKINVLKEHTEQCCQKIGDITIPAIIYGYGSMKIKSERKSRVSYICLLDADSKPIWSYIVPR